MGRLGALAALAASVLVLAACGSGAGEGAPSAGADLVPGTAALAAFVNTDFESDQWQAADALIERFPGGHGGFGAVFGTQEEFDFEQDIEPALGPESVIALLDGKAENVVVLTQPDDPAKLEALVQEDGVVRELSDGWWAAAESADLLDRFEQARDENESLAESDAWADATGELPDETLATVYVAGRLLEELGGAELPSEARGVAGCLIGEGAGSGFAVVAEDDGFRVEGSAALPEGLPEPDEGESALAEVLPGGALGMVSVRGLGEYLREALRCATEEDPELQTQLAPLELVLGLSLEEDVLPLLAQEVAVALYAPEDSTEPAVVAATQVEDATQALETVDRIVERAQLIESGLSLEETDVGGVPVRRVLVDGELKLAYGAVDGILGFSNVDGALLALRGQEPSLAEDEEYRRARDAAGAPDEDAGFLYLDAQRIIDQFRQEARSGGFPFDLSRDLEPLRSLLLWATIDDGRGTLEGFLRID